jgi:superfamily I DNA/RNA helicase/RecB family exonuclease
MHVFSAGDIVQVYGAPGTGKTSALVQFFSHLVLNAQVKPEKVLVLAATRESAALLRNRLALQLASSSGAADSGAAESGQAAPADEPYAVEGSLARTVSSLAFAIVRHNALALGLKQPELISGAEQDSILEKLLVELEDGPVADLWPSHVSAVTRALAGFRAELRDLISACQELGLSPDHLRELGSGQSARQEWIATSAVYEAYLGVLQGEAYDQRFDATSLINKSIELLDQQTDLPDFTTILVDDAQELTPSASRLLTAVTSRGDKPAGLVLFGDPDSSTLGFRHADPRIMTDLASQLASRAGATPKSLYLETDPWGKPSGLAPVMRKVSSLIGAEGAGAQRKVHASQAQPDSSGVFTVKVFSEKQDELEWLAFTLRKLHLDQQVPWGDIAIVSRSRQQLDWLERSLAAESVPVRIAGAQHALRDEFASRELLELAAVACSNADVTPELVERLLRSPFCGLDSVALRRLRRQMRREELSGLDEGQLGRTSDQLLVEVFRNPDAAATLRGPDAATLRRFLKSLASAATIAADTDSTIEDLLWQLWNSSGLEAKWSEQSRGIGEVAVQANRNLDAIVALFAAANRFVERNPGRDKSDFLIAQLEQRLPEDSLSFGRRAEQYVSLLTPAGVVGKRFHTVITPQLIEGIWPNLKPRNSLLNAGLLVATVTKRLDQEGAQVRSEMADELRMFYKALGAANYQAIVSSYLSEEEQVSQFVGHSALGGIPAAEAFEGSSLTLRGLAGSLRRKLAVETDPARRAKYAVDLGRLAAAGVPGAHPDDWYGLQELSTNEPLFEFLSSSLEGESVESDELAEDRGARITLNPSQLDAYLKCPLHWFLNYHGASEGDFSASVGTLIHRAMEVATSVDEASLWAEVESGWHTLKFESDWLEQAERRRAQRSVANLSKYLAEFGQSGGRVLGAEAEFELDLGRAHIRGKVDRIELTGDGTAVIVDLKTGSKIPSVTEGQENPQLGLYQLAYENGAFREVTGDENPTLAGAKLLLVGDKNPTIRNQESIANDPELRKKFEELVNKAAEGMAMPDRVFVARVSSHCGNENEFGSCDLHLKKAVSYVG